MDPRKEHENQAVSAEDFYKLWGIKDVDVAVNLLDAMLHNQPLPDPVIHDAWQRITPSERQVFFDDYARAVLEQVATGNTHLGAAVVPDAQRGLALLKQLHATPDGQPQATHGDEPANVDEPNLPPREGPELPDFANKEILSADEVIAKNEDKILGLNIWIPDGETLREKRDNLSFAIEFACRLSENGYAMDSQDYFCSQLDSAVEQFLSLKLPRDAQTMEKIIRLAKAAHAYHEVHNNDSIFSYSALAEAVLFVAVTINKMTFPESMPESRYADMYDLRKRYKEEESHRDEIGYYLRVIGESEIAAKEAEAESPLKNDPYYAPLQQFIQSYLSGFGVASDVINNYVAQLNNPDNHEQTHRMLQFMQNGEEESLRAELRRTAEVLANEISEAEQTVALDALQRIHFELGMSEADSAVWLEIYARNPEQLRDIVQDSKNETRDRYGLTRLELRACIDAVGREIGRGMTPAELGSYLLDSRKPEWASARNYVRRVLESLRLPEEDVIYLLADLQEPGAYESAVMHQIIESVNDLATDNLGLTKAERTICNFIADRHYQRSGRQGRLLSGNQVCELYSLDKNPQTASIPQEIESSLEELGVSPEESRAHVAFMREGIESYVGAATFIADKSGEERERAILSTVHGYEVLGAYANLNLAELTRYLRLRRNPYFREINQDIRAAMHASGIAGEEQDRLFAILLTEEYGSELTSLIALAGEADQSEARQSYIREVMTRAEFTPRIESKVTHGSERLLPEHEREQAATLCRQEGFTEDAIAELLREMESALRILQREYDGDFESALAVYQARHAGPYELSRTARAFRNYWHRVGVPAADSNTLHAAFRAGHYDGDYSCGLYHDYIERPDNRIYPNGTTPEAIYLQLAADETILGGYPEHTVQIQVNGNQEMHRLTGEQVINWQSVNRDYYRALDHYNSRMVSYPESAYSQYEGGVAELQQQRHAKQREIIDGLVPTSDFAQPEIVVPESNA